MKLQWKNKLQRTVMAGVFAALLVVLSQVSIPLPTGIPVTLQTFAVALCGCVLGPAVGSAAVGVYLALGAVGVPVFAGFSGGAGALVGMTGGYLWAFLPMAFLCGLGAQQNLRRRPGCCPGLKAGPSGDSLMTRLRGHHLFCATLFQGSGYDQAFTAQMERTLAALEAGEDFTFCAGPDSLCAACPNLRPGERCAHGTSDVARRDAAALAAEGSSLGRAFRPARRGRGCGR